MLIKLPQVETPRGKRKLINEAIQLALNSLSLLKSVDAYDYDLIISYLFYYASNRFLTIQNRAKICEYRLFSQLLYIVLFDAQHEATEYGHKSKSKDFVNNYFKLLWINIRGLNL